MKKRFIVEVPCTTFDRYFVDAESGPEVMTKIRSGEMVESTKAVPGDYVPDGTTDREPETHWNRALIVGIVEQV